MYACLHVWTPAGIYACLHTLHKSKPTLYELLAYMHARMPTCIYARLPAYIQVSLHIWHTWHRSRPAFMDCMHICIPACMDHDELHMEYASTVLECQEYVYMCMCINVYIYKYTYMYIGINGWSMWYTLVQYQQLLDQDFIHRLMYDLADTFMYIHIYIYILYTDPHKGRRH